METHRQAFFHASDAYSIDELGERYTWFKLASPRIEALRQAFIASDSRMRIGFDRLVHSAYQINLKGESMRKRTAALTQTSHRGS